MAAPGAAEQQLNRYDALGRLTRVCHVSNGDGERTDYNLDARDNRSSYGSNQTDIWLPNGTALSSADGRFTFAMQSDGNLVLYQNSNNQALWQSQTYGMGAYTAHFQGDGNLVVYKPGQALWSSNTYNYPCSRLAVQNDGNVVIYNSDNQAVWQTGTGGR